MRNNKTKSGFTLVELIIVIAVIGVLAAILIPVFSNVIAKSNLKSALSDARNSIEIFIAEALSGNNNVSIGEGSVVKVKKANTDYFFTFTQGALANGDGTEGADATAALTIDFSQVTILAHGDNCEYDLTSDIASATAAGAAEMNIDNLPDTVVMYITNAVLTTNPVAPGNTGADTPEQAEALSNIAQAMVTFASDSSLPAFTSGTITVSKASDGYYYAAIYVISTDGAVTYYTTLPQGRITAERIQGFAGNSDYTAYKPSGAAISISGATTVSSLPSETYILIFDHH